MSTSDTREEQKKERILYLAETVFILVFGMIYEHFSHQVYSAFMCLAWVIPFLGLFVNDFFWKEQKSVISRDLLAGAVIWQTLGSVFCGVLEIYGTTNHLILVFPVVAAAQLLAGLVVK